MHYLKLDMVSYSIGNLLVMIFFSSVFWYKLECYWLHHLFIILYIGFYIVSFLALEYYSEKLMEAIAERNIGKFKKNLKPVGFYDLNNLFRLTYSSFFYRGTFYLIENSQISPAHDNNSFLFHCLVSRSFKTSLKLLGDSRVRNTIDEMRIIPLIPIERSKEFHDILHFSFISTR